MSYSGPERRVHRVYVTHNSEYHTRRGTCIAVRSRRHQVWTPGHDAVGMKLTNLEPIEPGNGTLLLFRSQRTCVQTSPLKEIQRPDYNVFELYQLLKSMV